MLKSAPRAKIGTSQRVDLIRKELEGKPSPGAYEPSVEFVKTHSAAWRFGSSSRPDLANTKDKLPGP